MVPREQLIKEIEQAPDFLIEEVLNFLLFIKIRLKQRTVENQASVPSPTGNVPSFLSFIEEISSQVPQEEWAKLPSDLSKNLDHYLYGSPKAEGGKLYSLIQVTGLPCSIPVMNSIKKPEASPLLSCHFTLLPVRWYCANY